MSTTPNRGYNEIPDSGDIPSNVNGTLAQIDADVQSIEDQKGAVNGMATLDAGGKVPASQLPSSVMEWQGVWNAATNTPTLIDGTGNAGDVYRVSTGGTRNLGSGSQTYVSGDWVTYNGTIWERSGNSDFTDNTLPALDPTNSNALTTLRIVLANLWTAISGKAAAIHTHLAADISDATTAGKALLTAATASAQRIALELVMPASGFEVFPNFPGLTAATVTPASANVVYVAHFVLRQRITVAQTNVREVAGTTLTFISWGVYDSTGNTRLIDTTPINAATNSTKNVTLGSPVTLEPGLYWLAWTSSDATNSVVGVNLTTIANTINFGTGSPHMGTAANASSAGQLPTTLGTITGAAVNMPLVRLQS